MGSKTLGRRCREGEQRGAGAAVGGTRDTGRSVVGVGPPAKLLAQGRNLLPEARRALLSGLHAALQFGILPGQPAVAELQVLQAAQQVGCGGPGSGKGRSHHPQPSLLSQVEGRW